MQIDATGKISKEQLLSAIQQAVQYDPLENDNEQIRITEVSFNDVMGGFLDYMGAPIKTIDKVVGYTALMITGEATVTARVYYKIEDIAPADPSNPPDHSYFIAGVSHDDFTFRSVSNDCTVTFDGNGATSGSMSVFKVVKGQDATLSENQFELEHHLFDGWNTKSDGSGTSYDDKGTINVSSDVTLYAQWVPFTYAVMFDKNAADATGTMEDEAFAYDEEKALSANGFSREGHTFEAWNSKDDGSGDAYEDGALVKNLVETNKGSITLFAQWSVNEYTITFVNEDGTELQSEKVAFGDTPTYKGDEPTKAATAKCTYSFAGWDKEIAPVDGDTTYTATFDENPIEATLTYDPAGGTIDGKSDKVSVTANVGDEVTILDAPTRSGYTFQYWKGSKYQPGDTYIVEGDHTFTAVWKKNAAKKSTPKKANAKARTLPRTGDPTSMMAIAAMATAGAGLVMAGYRRRR